MDKAGTPVGVPAWFLEGGLRHLMSLEGFSNKIVYLCKHGERKDDGRADWRV